MTMSRLLKIANRTMAVGALLAGLAAVAFAQKAKSAGPPLTTTGTAKSASKADKGQDMAESKRADARADKLEATALKTARSEPKSLLKGIKPTSAEKKSLDAIQKKYSDQLKALDKQENAAEKAGTPDASIVAKIDALRLQERADLRAALTPAEQAQFDKNVTALGTKKG